MYLTPTEMRLAPFGLNLDNYADDELTVYIQAACDLIDVNTDNTWSFQWVGGPNPGDPEPDQQFWDGATLKFNARFGPVRTVTGLAVITGVWSGNDFALDIPTTPSPASTDPRSIPVNYGNIKINRRSNSLEAASVILSAGVYAPLQVFGDMFIEARYTSGYDAGPQLDSSGNPVLDGGGKLVPTAPDGLIMTAPSWLKTATRFTVKCVMEEVVNNDELGMQGLQEIRVADTLYRKPNRRGSARQDELPTEARRIVEWARGQSVWLA